MATTKIDKQEKRHLKVTWAKLEPEVKSPHLQILPFNCDDGIQYQTIKQDLFGHIKIGAEFDADTQLEIVTFDDGGQLTKWVVTQIYDKDGQPISKAATKKQASAYKGRDEDRVDARTFVMEVGADLRAGVIDKTHPFAKSREIILASWVTPQKKEVKGETKKTQTDKTPDTTEQAQSSKQISALEIHTGQDLMAWAKREKGLMPSQVRQTMNWGVKVITEKMAQEAYLKLKETEP